EITDNTLSDINTIEDWENARAQRYNEFIEMMGLQDYIYKDRADLNIKITGVIHKKGYRIEKLYYESLPGLYVPANLYIPDNIEKPTAAILYVCGHSPTQKVHYQPFPKKFAELGFVCMVIETIQWGEVKGEHWGCYANGWFNWYSRGYNPAGVELWNAIRGLDLLAARAEVDPGNMGVTGISGGGSQSWYIAAADQRIKAVAPVCGASTLKAQIGKRTIDGHCDCMMPTNTYQADFQDIGALIAPRALLIGQANRDGLNTIESVEQLYAGTKKIYELYGSPGKISLVETPGGHSYHRISREEINSFFLENLMGKKVKPEEAGDISLSQEDMLSEDELRVYIDGAPENDRTTKIQDSFVQLPAPPEINTKEELFAFRDTVKKFLAVKTFGAFPEEKIPLNSKMEFRSLNGAKYGWNIYSFDSEEGWRLKVDFRWKNKPGGKKPLMIVLRSYDEDRWASESFVSGLDTNWNIAYFETRGIGEYGWPPNLNWHVRRASAWTGRTVASMQVFDVLRCIEFCRAHENVDPGKIGIAARGGMAAIALYAALMDGGCDKLILGNPPATQDAPSRPDGRGETIEMLNCLRITDVYQIPALLYPTKISFSGEIPETYRWSERIIERLD
ncbi:Acetyl xylan esterase, partial [hydrothermal vent metagenome]